MKSFKPRHLLAALLAATLPLGTQAAAPKEVRLDYAYYAPTSLVLKDQGILEKRLAADGIAVKWVFSQGSNRSLEYLNGGSIDFASTAGLAAVLSRANGSPVKTVYIASRPEWTALAVPKDSPIKSLADLKGKKVAVTKAAGAHYLLIAALAKANLKFSDIQPAYLTPADGRAAFENGKVDAWVIWEPFLSAAQRQLPTRTLEGSQGLASYQRYYLTSSRFAAAHPQVLQTVYHELAEAGDWLRANPAEAARILGPLWGNLDPAIVEQANGRRSYQVRPVEPDGLGEQQKIADAFFAEGLLPRAVDTRAVATWQPEAEHVQ